MTEEQIKKFWEWCGFRDWTRFQVTYPDGLVHDQPELDLNNVFAWAVPKVRDCYISLSTYYEAEWLVSIESQDLTIRVHGVDEDPTLALFWAIYKVMEIA